MSTLNRLWATPFYRSGSSADRADTMRDYILANENDVRRKRNSPQRAHPAVFESQFDFLEWPDPAVSELKQFLQGHLGHVVKDACGLGDEGLRTLRFHSHSWFHVTREGGFFQNHNHPLASWSLVYCVDPGDAEPPNEFEAGYLVFQDPRSMASMYLDTANRHMVRDYSFDSVRFRPRKGDVLIFPSYVRHSVEPYGGSEPRITVAANYWFQTFEGVKTA